MNPLNLNLYLRRFHHLGRLPLVVVLLACSLSLSAQTAVEPAAEAAAAASDDACLTAVRQHALEADRTCSDLIAGLRYDGIATVASRQTLAAALGNRALARMRIGDLEGAETDFSEALDLTPDAWPILLNRATLALMNGDAAVALNYLGRVRQLAPENDAAIAAADRNAILAWRMLGNLEAADALSRGQQVPVAPAPQPG